MSDAEVYEMLGAAFYRKTADVAERQATNKRSQAGTSGVDALRPSTGTRSPTEK
jgi:hypothetical protein